MSESTQRALKRLYRLNQPEFDDIANLSVPFGTPRRSGWNTLKKIYKKSLKEGIALNKFKDRSDRGV